MRVFIHATEADGSVSGAPLHTNKPEDAKHMGFELIHSIMVFRPWMFWQGREFPLGDVHYRVEEVSGNIFQLWRKYTAQASFVVLAKLFEAVLVYVYKDKDRNGTFILCTEEYLLGMLRQHLI